MVQTEVRDVLYTTLLHDNFSKGQCQRSNRGTRLAFRDFLNKSYVCDLDLISSRNVTVEFLKFTGTVFEEERKEGEKESEGKLQERKKIG